MSNTYAARIAGELEITPRQVQAVSGLLEGGATVPFIARYRKERTGSLDEVAIAAIRERLARLAELDARRKAIHKSLSERDLLTDDLKAALDAADSLSVLEDLYLPYRPKRRTRAMIAREKGLEPLAERLFTQDDSIDPEELARAFVDADKGVASVPEALTGARDIIAEWVSEDARVRSAVRELFAGKGTVRSRVEGAQADAAAKYRDYFDWEESITTAPSHRVLAMFRGEQEGVLKLVLRPPIEEALTLLRSLVITGECPSGQQVGQAVEDGYARLLAPSLETEIRNALKERADEEAVRVFAQNLRELLMAPPLGQKRVLAIDPGYRTGGKVVCLGAQGQLLQHTAIYPTQSDSQRERAAETVRALVRDFGIEAIAIGNGTASRETEAFVRGLELRSDIPVVLVNESGASIYSASAAAREEFPDVDVTVRGAVSIGRRLMDPLAELVKIDPKSIGVGQYQHDVDQKKLKVSLADVVESCVNGVGVEVNTASVQLLTAVSGLGPTLAKNVVAHRDEHGPFCSRKELQRVPRLGPKAFEQAAGFLRIRDADHPLDSSAVHPERYALVERMAADTGCSVGDLMKNDALRERIDLDRYTDDSVGIPTLTDILEELAKPGRDPREHFESFSFAEGVHTLDDLEPGMRLPGIVTNVTNFGAFVDVGVHQEGLVHISQLADRYVKDPAQIVKVRQRVTVTVIEVDKDRRRIALSMRADPLAEKQPPRDNGPGKRGRPKRDWVICPPTKKDRG